MYKLFFSLLLSALLFASPFAKAQQVPVIKYPDLEKTLQTNKEKLLVVNFWATWCKPCIAEMPHLLRMADTLKAHGVKLVFVSFDFRDQLTTRVIPFVKKTKIQQDVMLLDEPNPNSFINKVNTDWSGSIPATLIVNNAGKQVAFHEGEFTYDTLLKFIQPHL